MRTNDEYIAKMRAETLNFAREYRAVVDDLRAEIEDANRYAALLAAARAVVETWDRWMATASPDRPSIQDLDAAINALRPSSAPWYTHA